MNEKQENQLLLLNIPTIMHIVKFILMSIICVNMHSVDNEL